MPLADYAHHNEEAERIWWEEEGKHHDADLEAHYADDFGGREDAYGPADAYAEELGEIDDDVELIDMLSDNRLTDMQLVLVRNEITRRGITLADER